MSDDYEPGFIADILSSVKTIAVVGASANDAKPSHDVSRFLLNAGYDVIPVNPHTSHTEILGQTVFRSLGEIERPVDMVDVFRPSKELYGIAQQAVDIGAKVLWGQLGIHDDAAKQLAEAAGLKVVMDRCPKIELRQP